MSDARGLVVVGSAEIATLAATIGVSERGGDRVRMVDLAPDRIAGESLDMLASDAPGSTEVFAAIGRNALNYARFDLWAKLRLKGLRCATLVHPRAFVDPSAVLGDNVLVGPGAIVEPGAHVGRGTIVGSGAVVATNARVGPWVWLGSRAVVGAGAEVGPHSVIGEGVNLAEHAVFPGPGEISIAGTYRGPYPSGTFIASEFPLPGARLVPRAG